MKLTGKCKDDFENWLSFQLVQSGYIKEITEFYMFPESMQYGVYIDFFNSVGICSHSDFGFKNANEIYNQTKN